MSKPIGMRLALRQHDRRYGPRIPPLRQAGAAAVWRDCRMVTRQVPSHLLAPVFGMRAQSVRLWWCYGRSIWRKPHARFRAVVAWVDDWLRRGPSADLLVPGSYLPERFLVDWRGMVRWMVGSGLSVEEQARRTEGGERGLWRVKAGTRLDLTACYGEALLCLYWRSRAGLWAPPGGWRPCSVPVGRVPWPVAWDPPGPLRDGRGYAELVDADPSAGASASPARSAIARSMSAADSLCHAAGAPPSIAPRAPRTRHRKP